MPFTTFFKALHPSSRRALLSTPLKIAVCMISFAATSFASKGDLLIEGGPLVSGRNLSQLDQPGIGVSAAVLSSFTEQADIGFSGFYEHQNGSLGGLDLATIGVQSWFSGFRGPARPQLGANFGLALDDAYNASLHISAQARALLELKSLVRLYLGAAFGGNISQRGSTYKRGEFGTQFRID